MEIVKLFNAMPGAVAQGMIWGLMAYEILANGADISAMPIEYAPQFTKKYNAANAEALGLTIPADYTAIE